MTKKQYTPKNPRITYNPFCRLDPVEHWAERWQRRMLARIAAIAVGAMAMGKFLWDIVGF